MQAAAAGRRRANLRWQAPSSRWGSAGQVSVLELAHSGLSTRTRSMLLAARERALIEYRHSDSREDQRDSPRRATETAGAMNSMSTPAQPLPVSHTANAGG